MSNLFIRKDEGMLQLSLEVFRSMLRFRQEGLMRREAGGVLLGRMIDGTEDVIIDEATKPTIYDKRKRFFFIRAKLSGSRNIKRAWSESNGTRNYLGEWHTHPEEFPVPSIHDMQNWSNIITEARIEQNYLFFAIVGTLELCIWEWRIGEKKPIKLKAWHNIAKANAR